MIDLEKGCEMIILSEENIISNFDCGNADLNDFFNRDALEYKHQMLSRTYFFRHKISGKAVCAFSFSASSIKTADLIEVIKHFCLINFPDFVRFLLVDAYNEPAVIGFYQKIANRYRSALASAFYPRLRPERLNNEQ